MGHLPNAKTLLSSRRRREKIADTASFLILLIMAAGAMLPIWWIFRSSLMSNAELYSYPPKFFPSKWLFSNYVETLQAYDFGRYLINTMTIIVPSVFGVIIYLCGQKYFVEGIVMTGMKN